MAQDDTYNGWTNRETWAVALYINNDQGWQESVMDALRTAAEEYREEECDACEDGETHPLPVYRAADIIRENVENLITVDGYRETFGEPIPEAMARIAEDIGSLYRVNWDELGASFLSDITEEG